ncbi:MAG TPA: FIST N-terminal domain-containing protein [Thermoanaerobaculia bacterium]|nr:FIST N-terminal domain-containing protein [Thermoanaerobaculia bacterium]
MTESAAVFTTERDSAAAGKEIGEKLMAGLSGKSPHAVILFASSRYDYGELLRAVKTTCDPGVMVGCSSAGEFISRERSEGAISALGIRSNVMRFSAGLGRNLRSNRRTAAEEIAASFTGLQTREYPHRAALVLADALAGYTDDFIEQLSRVTLGNYRFFGGGAGDDAQFSTTHVFLGTEAVTDAAVGLEILSHKPIAVGVSHGWMPAGKPLRVTEASGSTVISLNASPAIEAFEEHAERTAQSLDRANPIPFFLHNVLGIDTGAGFKLRVPLAINADGSVSCASDIPTGATVQIMKTTSRSAAEAAMKAATSALQQLGGAEPEVALFFDCVATRLRMGVDDFGVEMEALQKTLGDIAYAGCNTYGQIARSEGQFSGFHNCTATVALLPD